MKIAIQGIEGSFHHMVATSYFGNDIELIKSMSFDEIPELIRTNSVDAGVMAIENSSSGSILSNYALIDKYDLNIQGEVYIPMIHNVMALKGQKLEDIKEVWSHPIAIQHCERFFRDHPQIKIIEEKDTAFVAKQIKEKKLKGIATIASKKAADIYGLNILEEQIQTDSLNMTRFFILTKKRDFTIDVNIHNKTSLRITTSYDIGSLSKVLNICVDHELSLSNIQSVPIVGESWNYAFFIDFTYTDYLKYCNALLILENEVTSIKILGEYTENKPSLNKLTA